MAADNPGIGFEWFGSRELEDKTFTRPGAILPVVIPPIVGYHEVDDRDLEGGPGVGPGKSHNTLPSQKSGPLGRSKGILIDGFYDLFWKDRLHIIENSKDFGNILSAQEGTFQIYNSGTKVGQHTRVVTTLNDLTSLGITIITGTVAFPFTLAIGESEVYEYLVSLTGPATINDAYNFDFDNGVVLSHAITGSRILLFLFDPQEPFTERWTWITDVIKKADGTEQRISVRNTPRQEILHNYFYNDPVKLTKIENVLYTRLPAQIGLNYWKDFVQLTAAVGIGATILPVTNTTDMDFRVGQSLVINDPVNDLFEVGTIAAVATNSITVTTPLLQAWAADLEIMPVFITFVDAEHVQTRFPKDIGSLPLSFLIQNNIDFSDASGFPTYQGDPIYTDSQLLSGNNYTRVFDYGVHKFSNPFGLDYEDSVRLAPDVIQASITAKFINRTQYARIRDFLHSRRGRQVSFWLTTMQSDFIPANTNPGTPTQVDSTITGYADVFAKGFRVHAEIEFTDGTIDRREITNVIVTGSFEQLVFDSALSQEWSVANVARASYILRVRLDVDSLEFVHNWHNNGFVRFTVREIQA